MQYYVCSFEFVLGKKSPKKAQEFITFKYRFYNLKQLSAFERR